jgi:hypothetical protein
MILKPPIAPMLAKLAETLPEKDYLYEPKWEGSGQLSFAARMTSVSKAAMGGHWIDISPSCTSYCGFAPLLAGREASSGDLSVLRGVRSACNQIALSDVVAADEASRRARAVLKRVPGFISRR